MAAAAAAAKKMTYEFTTDDDELNEEKTVNQGTMCNFYKINLPASASILSKQIAKSQAKRAKKEERSRRRVDLSTVREQDETKLSASSENEHASPLPTRLDDVAAVSAPPSQFGGRSRIDSAPVDVKLKRQNSLGAAEDVKVKAEPMDEEEAGLLAMLLSGIDQLGPRINLPTPSPGLPRMAPGAKVSEWLLERSTSPDNVSVVSSVLLEDSGLHLNPEYDEDEDDVFFDAPEEKITDDVENDVLKSLVNDGGVEHEMQGKYYVL
uniref:Uncharacterized protein n=1 Tax=Caenorhabditis japonica TaxID=281687 RepID=A0A8R1DN60_CAEJA